MRWIILVTFGILIAPVLASQKAIIDHGVIPEPGESLIWSPLFKATWDKLQSLHSTEIEKVTPSNAAIEYLQKFKYDELAVMPMGRYKIYAGPANLEFFDEVAREVKKEFDVILDRTRFPLSPSGNLAIGALNAKLEFKKAFYNSNKARINFKSSDGKSSQVAFFGTKGNYNLGFGGNITIEYFDREKNEFIVSIKTKREKERVVLLLPNAPVSIEKAIGQVLLHRKPEKEKPSSLDALPMLAKEDILKIPYISINNETDFTGILSGEIIYEGDDQPHQIVSAHQFTLFELDEKGAKVKLVTGVGDLFGGAPLPREFIFDKPFFVFLWKDEASHPYFALWVDDASILQKIP